MDFAFLINSCHLFKQLMDFLDSWIFRVALDKIFNTICTLIYNVLFWTTIHMSTRPEGILDLDKNPVTPLL